MLFSRKSSSFLPAAVVCCGQEKKERRPEDGKRRCVKTDEITVNMLVHALRDVFREEKDAGASTKETGDLILRLASHKDKKLYLTDGEHKKAVQALNGLRDTYIENGRYTDGIATVLMRIMNARYRTYRTR